MGEEPKDFFDLEPNYFIEKLRTNCLLDQTGLQALFSKTKKLLLQEPNVLTLSSPITVCGDIHGQMLDLFKLFDTSGYPWEDQSLTYLFMGDYVDRGYSSIETFAFLAYLKCKFSDRIYLLRGNHESRTVNQSYGLCNQCILLYGGTMLWECINEVFDCLPLAAVIDNRIFAVHGGLSPRLCLIEQIYLINRRKDIGDTGPMSDLTWSDPADDNKTAFNKNSRGSGYVFGEGQSAIFLHNNKLGPEKGEMHGFIARSHQLAKDGYEWKHSDKLVIVWSAPNYAYRMANDASVMKVFKDRKEEFRVFTADENSAIKPDTDVVSSYFL